VQFDGAAAGGCADIIGSLSHVGADTLEQRHGDGYAHSGRIRIVDAERGERHRRVPVGRVLRGLPAR